MDGREHWDTIYRTKTDQQLSWFEPCPDVSVRMLEAAGLTQDTSVLDVGAGESRLVDYLVGRGLQCLAVLDVSQAALDRAKARLGEPAAHVTWIAADVTADWSLTPMDIWHDRAVFHFLADAGARARYRQRVRQVVKPGGAVIMATFALEGPDKCSGLPDARYSSESLAEEMGDGFRLVRSVPHVHQTPWGATQAFQYSLFTYGKDGE